MHCWNCSHNLRGLDTGHCPRCGAWFSTGAELLPLRARLLHPVGPCRCVVCRADLTDFRGSHCPHCSARFRTTSAAASLPS